MGRIVSSIGKSPVSTAIVKKYNSKEFISQEEIDRRTFKRLQKIHPNRRKKISQIATSTRWNNARKNKIKYGRSCKKFVFFYCYPIFSFGEYDIHFHPFQGKNLNTKVEYGILFSKQNIFADSFPSIIFISFSRFPSSSSAARTLL